MEGDSFVKDLQLGAPLFKALAIATHLYTPLLYMAEKDGYGKRPFVDDVTGEVLVRVSPLPLNNGERNFVTNLQEYCFIHKDDLLAGKQVYLLRNESRKGIGFFEANNFYPDFILWTLCGNKQHVSFVDPKGVSHLKGSDDAKVNFFKYLQHDVSRQLGKPNLILNSFIISNTPMRQIEFWKKNPIDADEFTRNHILFGEDVEHIDKLMQMHLSDSDTLSEISKTGEK